MKIWFKEDEQILTMENICHNPNHNENEEFGDT